MLIKAWMDIIFFLNGWVSNVSVTAAMRTPDIKLVFGSVKHSQRISDTLLKPWVAAKKEGTVVCAHCTCMVGLGEACSHIAALLFTLEKNTQQQNMTTCTSLPCSWLPPSYQAVTYSEIANIDFTTPQLKRRKGESADSPSTSASTRMQVAPPSDEEIARLHKDLFHAGKPVLLSLVPEYSDHFVQVVSCQIHSQIFLAVTTLIYRILTYSKNVKKYLKHTLSRQMLLSI